MYSVGLRVCSFFIKPRHSSNDNRIALNQEIKYKIGTFAEAKAENFFSILNEFVKRYSSFDDDEQQKRMFSLVQSETKLQKTSHYTTLYVVVKSGAYGYEGELTDKNSGKINYKRTINDADIKTFSCLIFIPKDSRDSMVKKGIIVFQEFGIYGVKTVTIEKLAGFLSLSYEISLETRSISPASFVKAVLKTGEIQKITFIKNTISSDDSDNLVMNAGREEHSYIAPIVRQSAIDKLFKPRILNTEGAIEFEDDVFDEEKLGDYSDIKFNVNYANRQSTISMIDMSRFSIVEPVPDEFLLHSGLPDKERLRAFMIDTARKYRDLMIFQ